MSGCGSGGPPGRMRLDRCAAARGLVVMVLQHLEDVTVDGEVRAIAKLI